ncbi:MAG: hypothetical protein EOP54_27895, partial [Sphingobacteriales bacterium]
MKLKLFIAVALMAVITGCKKQNPITRDEPPVTGVAFTVSNLFQDNMVLQRNKPINIWGTGEPGRTVTVTANWGIAGLSTVDNKGFWIVSL